MTDTWRAEAVQIAKTQGVRRHSDATLDADVTLVINDTLEVLSRIYPDCRVYIYGSRLVGLAFNDSDIDLFIDLGEDMKQQELQDAFGRVKNLLARSGIFCNVFGISRARVPVITCEHKATRIACDFNIHNKLCVSKSRLLSYYCNLHSDIKLAMLVVKMWTKRHSDLLVSNYAMTMMLLFYLAQKSLVPPPLALLRSVETPEFDGNWQQNFQPLPFTCKATDSFNDLIKGFFQFMATYNFGLEMMKVQSIQSLPKSAACSPLDAMWVQDPLELDHNTTKNITLPQCQAFQDFCAAQVVLCVTPGSTIDQLLSSPTPSTRKQKVVPADLAEFRIYPNGFKMSVISSALWHKLATKIIRDIMLHVMFCVEAASAELYDQGKLEIVYFSKCAMWFKRKSAKKALGTSSRATTPLGSEVEISQYLKQKEKMPYLKNADTLHFKMGMQFASDPTYITITLKEIKSWKNMMFNFSQFLNSCLQQFVDKGFAVDYSKDLIALNYELAKCDDAEDLLSPPGKIMKVTNSNKSATEMDKITSSVSTLVLDKPPPPIPAVLKLVTVGKNSDASKLVLAPQYQNQPQKIADKPSVKKAEENKMGSVVNSVNQKSDKLLLALQCQSQPQKVADKLTPPSVKAEVNKTGFGVNTANQKSDKLVLAPQYQSQSVKVAEKTPLSSTKTGVSAADHEKLVAARRPDAASLVPRSILKVKTSPQSKDDKCESTKTTAEIAQSVTVNSVKPDLKVIHECLNAKSFNGTSVPLNHTINKLASLKITITGNKRQVVPETIDDPLRNRATHALFTSASTRGLMQKTAGTESMDDPDELDLIHMCTSTNPLLMFGKAQSSSSATANNIFSVPPPVISHAKQDCPHRASAKTSPPYIFSAKGSGKAENPPSAGVKEVSFSGILSSVGQTHESLPYQVNPPLPVPKKGKFAPNCSRCSVEKI